MAQVPATSIESTSLGDVAEFTIPFPFLSRAEVFVTVDGASVPFTWINDGLVQLSAVPELGAVVRRYRSTAAYVPLHQFSTGVPFLPRYVDRDFKQTLYAVQESVNDTAGTASQALATAEESLLLVQDAFDILGARTQYIVLGPYAAGLHFETTSQVFSYLGEFYAPGPSITLPYTTTGAGAGEIANFRSVGDAVLRSDLAATDGAERVGFGGVTVAEELERSAAQSTSPEQHGYSASGTLAQRTAAVQSAFNYANTQKIELRLNKSYIVDTIFLDGHLEYNITGTGNLIGGATVARQAVLEMKNCRGIKSSSTITVSGNDNLNYSGAIKIWSDVAGGSSLLFLDFNAIRAYIGWIFGDLAQPDRLLSEIVISRGFTSSTPQPLVCIGTQTVIEFNGYQLIAEANAPFTASTPVVAQAVGATIHINGGECILASSATGRAFIVQPIDSPGFDNSYGRVLVSGSQIESASLILLAYNPSAVPSVAPNTGGLRLSTCSGYHNFAGVSFQGVADFSGKVVVEETCDFYAPALRIFDTAAMAGPAKISISSNALFNFKAGLGAFSGGILSFPHQEIFHADNLAGVTSSVAGTITLKFTNVPAGGNNLRFSANYNSATGIFTVPAGGLKNVQVFTQFTVGAPRPNSEVTILADSYPWGVQGLPSKYLSTVTAMGDLSEGAQIKVNLQNLDATFNFGSTTIDRIMISASC